ncbi:MAG: bifunctional fucokinase/fucose-1-phosphate guanylyltransferase [Kiritimatiellaeota bacterium]|nr:bifunctional fucokinase/fucose-1-phosphate guanylyltransferase [Kiritimatiellota bacterium]
MSTTLAQCEPRVAASVFAASDPPECQLGSGGGAAWLLEQAWRARGDKQSFDGWLDEGLKVIVHGGGESRRLPAYAAPGKLFLPLPVFRWALGQRLDQTLFDAQRPLLDQLAARAPSSSRLMIASGDVLIRAGRELPVLPDADIIAIGLGAKPETAQHFGVFFCPHQKPDQLAFFLQKPTPDRIRELANEHLFFIDTGIWILSARAVAALLAQCGWDAAAQKFRGGVPKGYGLYDEMGLHLGSTPNTPDQVFSKLTTAVVTLPGGAFHHFGNNRDIISSALELQNLGMDHTDPGMVRGGLHPRQFIQNAVFHFPLRREINHTLWVENSFIPAGWKLAREHVLTGVPENDWQLRLEPGVCLDFVPVGEKNFAIRAYGIGDVFRGRVGDAATQWFGRAAAGWFAARGLTLAQAGLDAAQDIQQAALFPVFAAEEIEGGFIEWLCAAAPANDARWQHACLAAPRLSASDLAQQANLARLYAQRRRFRETVLPLLALNHEKSIFYKLDLAATAELFAESKLPLPPTPQIAATRDPLLAVHDHVFRAAVQRKRGATDWEAEERASFALLREAIVTPVKAQPVQPVLKVLEDQIIWGRSGVRLDLAGGWTDTPPYCIEHGGSVVNVSVDLNGQPPIQVFVRVCERPELVMRSIDLGLEEHLRTYQDVADYSRIQSGFSIARAAFALCGFHPDFNGGSHDTLEAQLKAFGGGIEISLLAAVPKGSGLGTSSILAATLLGTLADFCGLNWSTDEIFRRTSALEQMLTSGGGWQDQIGGLLHGIKLVETRPGLDQQPTVRWLPERFFSGDFANEQLLLYYTGLTRVAHNILKEIVRGIFLNAGETLDCLGAIGRNAAFVQDAIQRQDFECFGEAIRRSWLLNQRLDAGTNTPATQAILDAVADDLLSAKLLGAGGGGYFLMAARDAAAAHRIRRTLTEWSPNPRARFVDFSLSTSGLQITRS